MNPNPNLPDYFRPITGNGIKSVKPEGLVGPPIKMQWISIEKLFVDTRYQREIATGDKSNVRQIGQNFRWRRFAPVIVTPIEGTDCFSIIDGQHKTTGALLRGLKIVPCAIVEAATLEEQGDSFKFLNANITRIAVFDIYKANLASKDPQASRLDATLKKAGIKLVSSITPEKKMKERECRSYKTLVSNLRLYGESIFVKAGKTLTNNVTSKAVIKAATLGALCALFKNNPRWMTNEIVDKTLAGVNFTVLFNQSHAKAKSENATHKTVLTRMLYDKISNALKESEHAKSVADPVPLSSLPPAGGSPRAE